MAGKRQTISYVLEAGHGKDKGHQLGVNGLALDKGQSILYSGGRDGRLCAWKLSQGPQNLYTTSTDSTITHPQRQTRPHIHWINDIALTPDSSALVSASNDTTVKVWLPHSHSDVDVHTLGRHTDYVKRLASPITGNPGAGEWIASGGLDRKVHLWDLGGKGSILEIDTAADGSREKGSVYALAVGPRLIATGGPNRIVTLWDPRSGAKINSLIGHTDMIRSVLIDAAGETLISASSDNTVKVWSTKNFKCINTLYMHDASVWSLHSDDRRLRVFYSGDSSGLIAKTDLCRTNEYVIEGVSVAVGREDGGVVKLVTDGQHIWTGTDRPRISRWADVDDVVMDSLAAYRRTSLTATHKSPSPIPDAAILNLSSVAMPGTATSPVVVVVVVPIRQQPEDTIEGASGVVRSRFLKDRRSVLTVDTNGEVALWDIVQARHVKSFGKRPLEDVQAEIEDDAVVTPDSWCTVDTSSGSLVVTLDPSDCFSAECYLDEILSSDEMTEEEFNQDQRVNFGKWVLRYLFANLVDTEMRRDEEYRNSLATGSAVVRKPILPLIRIPGSPFGSADWVGTPKANAAKVMPLSPGAIKGIGTPAAATGLPNILETADPAANNSPGPPASRQSMHSARSPSRNAADYFGGTTVPTVPGVAETASVTPVVPNGEKASGQDLDEPKDAASKDDKTPSTPFSKLFSRSLPFGRRRASSTASEKRSVVAAAEAAQTSAVSGTSEPVAKDAAALPEEEPDDSFASVIKLIRAKYVAKNRDPSAKALETRLSPGLASEVPVLAIPSDVKIIIRDHTADALNHVYLGTVGSVGSDADVDLIEARGAGWLAELLLLNLPATPNKDSEEKKMNFLLLPLPDSDMPMIAGPNGEPRVEPIILSAYRLLRVRKALYYVAERLGYGEREMQRPEEYLELWCNGHRLDPLMTLLQVRKTLWRGPGAVEMFYRTREGVTLPRSQETEVEAEPASTIGQAF